MNEASKNITADHPYALRATTGRYQVITDEGSVVLECDTAGNAEQYLVLLNQAYHRGYKAGIRKAGATSKPGNLDAKEAR